jgi:hypothetical protein
MLQGELKIGDLARKHRLTVADMENALASRLGTFVHGRVERQVLFTPAFIQKQTATIIGALTAATRPTSTLDIIQRFRLQPELFETTLKQVCRFLWCKIETIYYLMRCGCSSWTLVASKASIRANALLRTRSFRPSHAPLPSSFNQTSASRG